VSPNKQTVERYMETFSRSDKPAVVACLTDNVEWVLPGAFHLHGKAQFEAEIVNDAFEPNPAITTTRLTEEDDVVVAEGRVRALKKDGEVVSLVFCDVFEMRGALIRRLTSYLMPVEQPSAVASQPAAAE
jgi:ketosteroid isomerase-like protein